MDSHISLLVSVACMEFFIEYYEVRTVVVQPVNCRHGTLTE